MSRMTQNRASDHNFKVKEIQKVKFYILNDFLVHKLKQTYIDFIFMYIKTKTWKLYLKLQKNKFGHFGHVMESKYSALT